MWMAASIVFQNVILPKRRIKPSAPTQLRFSVRPKWPTYLKGQKLNAVRNYKNVMLNFFQALNFTNQVGALAEEEGHHPAILTEWGQVTVTWWTHKIKGLHSNDFIMAAKTDKSYRDIQA